MDRGPGAVPGTGVVVGRDDELSVVREFLGQAGGRASMLVAVGDPGSGKSTLLQVAAQEAARRGFRVLSCTGHEGEQELAFGALHQLLSPVLDYMEQLPAPQGKALSRAFGIDAAAQELPAQPERLLINLAVLNLLSLEAAVQPVLLVVDDLQWLDSCSQDALAFVARRAAEEPMAILAGARGASVPQRFLGGVERLEVTPLDESAAEALLAAQPQPPAGLLKSHILEHAAGNPLALVELTRALGSASGSLSSMPEGTMPLTERLEAIYAERLDGLPQATQRVLLFAAAADHSDMSAALLAASAVVPQGGTEAWLVAEEAGLVTLDSGRVAFRHPLVRSAVYGAAPFAARRDVHLKLAEALKEDPDRRAWHMAAATLIPDEQIAHALVETADRARRRGGYRVAAAALERAAALTPDASLQARRLVTAAELAMLAGEPWWVDTLASYALAVTDDPELSVRAALLAGWALTSSTRQKAALNHLFPLAAATVDTNPSVALSAISCATIIVYNTGDESHRREALRLLDRIAADVGGPEGQAWARAGCDPFRDREGHLARLRSAAAQEFQYEIFTTLGGCAWILDETALAVDILGNLMDHLQRVSTIGSNATVGQALALAQFDSGAWDAAWVSAEDARKVATANGLDMAGRAATYVSAALLALRGETASAGVLVEQAAAGIDASESRALEARTRMVRSFIASAEGEHVLAYHALRGLFSEGPEPRPLHYHASYYGIADLAAAAVRVGQEREARMVVRSAASALAGRMSPRVQLLLLRAQALLAAEGEKEGFYTAALEEPAGEQWPFERALTLLEYGEWLRRKRRTGDARTRLAQALTIFERLRARPFAARAGAELRACGVVLSSDGQQEDGLDKLTAQQLQIARLAAQGLTNRQIGERLLLSDRTVGFHLYQTYPKLGVSNRTQLRDALSRRLGS
jgi:DNA-binding CsgD family transcriptional regulator